VRIIRDDDGRAEIQDVTEPRLRCRLANIARWERLTREGTVSVFPPAAIVQNLLAWSPLPLPVLTRIVEAPLFAPNGALIKEQGYSPVAKIFYESDLEIPDVPVAPTDDAVAGARSVLLKHLFVDFPFAGPADLANAVGLCLLPFVREMILEPTPLHLIEKPSPGTGATLLVECIATIATGKPATVLTEARDEEEWRKRITSSLRPGPTFLFIDNLSRPLDSPSLAAAITCRTWNDRILGRSEIASLPVRCIWVATGNNPTPTTEIARRSIPIRLDAKVDQPWQRDSEQFRHRNIKSWVVRNRADLVHACLLLVQNWIHAGKPVEDSVSLGGFESWAHTIGGILQASGIPGFLDNLPDFYTAADEESGRWRSFVKVWWNHFGEDSVGVAQLWKLIEETDLDVDLGEGPERTRRIKLGIQLRRSRGRYFGSIRLDFVGHRGGSAQWRLRECPESRGLGGPNGPLTPILSPYIAPRKKILQRGRGPTDPPSPLPMTAPTRRRPRGRSRSLRYEKRKFPLPVPSRTPRPTDH
jgi:putative DNA primase/helicase